MKKILKNDTIKPYFTIFIVAFLQLQQLQISTSKLAFMVAFFNMRVLLSIGTLFCLILLISLFKKKYLICIGCVAITLFSIANYYTFKFHGGPLFFSTLKSAKTALNVGQGYSFHFDGFILAILLMLILEILCVKILDLSKISAKSTLIVTACMTIIITIALQTNPYAWSVPSGIANEGFPISFIRDLTSKKEIVKPEYYKKYQNRTITGKETPDIILILNESYTTLGNPSRISNIKGSVYGTAIASQGGGGTNNSEFELLTSCSMKMLPAEAPFNYLKESELRQNTVMHFKSLGYETSALHCCPGTNYNRDIAYPSMGFDNVYLGGKFFTEQKYGNRPMLDSDNYKDMLKYCKPDKNDPPQFVYLLTYQNHGGYLQNDDSLDTVHATEYGKYNSEASEFLSSVELSEKAFLELIDQFKDSDRHTIICMVGDHTPPFIPDTETDEIKQKKVNYIIWSNYDLDFENTTLTMTDILPVVMKTANIKTNDFLETVYETHRRYPIRTTTGLLIDKDGNQISYDGTQEILNEYYSKAYDKLTSQEKGI